MIRPTGDHELPRERAERLRADFDGRRGAAAPARIALGRWLIRTGVVLAGVDHTPSSRRTGDLGSLP